MKALKSERPLLEVRDLTVSVRVAGGKTARIVDHVSFEIERGGTLGLVGESGSGKTMTSLAVIGLLPRSATIEAGEILIDGQDTRGFSRKEMQLIRGSRISMVMQDPMTALDPSFTIRSQMAESYRMHRGLRGSKLETAIVDGLNQVHVPSARSRLGQYPHQLSGGMRQRVVSAIALAGRPAVLIADEPTTALDVTTQARYLKLLRDIQSETGVGLLFVSHDLLVVKELCSRLAVMYSSQIVEMGDTSSIFAAPAHPYTRALLAAIPTVGRTNRLDSIEGQAPDIGEVVAGCRFASRCRSVRDECGAAPALSLRASDHLARCWATAADGWSY